MTTLYRTNIRCSVCGTEAEQTGIASTNAFGSPDLDTRPPEMERTTIDAWVQRCPGCGTCADDLSKANACAGDVIKRPDYLAQLRDSEFPGLTNSFICKSMIDDHGEELASATWALIHAAWACDDVEATPQAITCRRRAATMLRKTEASGQKLSEQPGASTAILVDLLRRAGDLDEAAEIIEKSEESFSDKIIIQVVDYERKLIRAGDLGCHTISEALGEGGQSRVDASSAGGRQSGTAKRWWLFWR